MFFRQLATRNMLLLAVVLLPLYFLALGLLLLYYQKFHVWTKEGVSVGFVYDTRPEVKSEIHVFVYFSNRLV